MTEQEEEQEEYRILGVRICRHSDKRKITENQLVSYLSNRMYFMGQEVTILS